MRAEADSRDQTKFFDYHREHEHTIDSCRHMAYLFEMLVKKGHLGQYVPRIESSGHNKEAELVVV